MKDKYGNRITQVGDSLILQTPKAEHRIIGKLITKEINGEEIVIYFKHENEAHTFRAMDAWSINYNALLMCDYVHYSTNLREYWIDRESARMKGKFLKLQNAEEKIYVPKEHWLEYGPLPTENASPLENSLGPSWFHEIKHIFSGEEMTSLRKFLDQERSRYTVYPEEENIFRTFREVPYDKLRILVIGQDPYADGQAVGLAFATRNRINPSLRKILEGMEDDLKIGEFLEKQNDLSYLSKSGIMLLNASLTVRKNAPGSHSHMWKYFTESLISVLNNHSPMVYLLWGKPAQSFKPLIDQKHVIIETEHPAYAARQGRMWEHKNCFSKSREIIYHKYGEHIVW